MSHSRRAKATTAFLLAGVIALMLGLTAASVPLYRLFCEVTGYGGTTQIALRPPAAASARTIKVRFNADVDPRLPWRFAPAQREIEVRLGEQSLAFYRAINTSSRPIVGQAVYNVTPYKAGPYFTKIACFCFDQQVLKPGEEAEMPVSFYVDPAILTDRNAKDVTAITLSYTFFMLEDETEALAERTGAVRPSS
ncbi:MAG: cytochrome c oxidase assembly protein [Geminicoccaceae bacterium]